MYKKPNTTDAVRNFIVDRELHPLLTVLIMVFLSFAIALIVNARLIQQNRSLANIKAEASHGQDHKVDR